ncbi:MAG: tRNA pseudouridine(13) synthase TruD [Candidatus Omnitrophota bacterium]
MKLTIKSRPEDFIVEEVAPLPLTKKGTHGVYLLTKKGWNTLDVLRDIAKKLRIHFENLSYGGKKDRHALTTQYITIAGARIGDFEEKNYILRFAGFMDRPMGPDLIAGNKFEITLRKLKTADIESAKQEMAVVGQFGFPNFFDDQRFGSFDLIQGFFAEKILKGHFNGALKIYLTAIHSDDKKEEKDRKKFFIEHWKDWAVCKTCAKTEWEQKAFDFLAQSKSDFLPLLRQIPDEVLSLYISAYQSFIWNEVLRRVLAARKVSPLKAYKGIAGDYLFFGELNADDDKYFRELIISGMSGKTKMPDSACEEIYAQILKEQGITHAMFNKLKLRQGYFKSTDRSAVIKPENLSFEVGDDELNHSAQKMILKFILPRGSYATMLVKRLFSHKLSN